MNVLETLLIITFLFIFTVFLFPHLETALASVVGSEALKPILDFVPFGIVGAVFFTIFYLGVKRD